MLLVTYRLQKRLARKERRVIRVSYLGRRGAQTEDAVADIEPFHFHDRIGPVRTHLPGAGHRR